LNAAQINAVFRSGFFRVVGRIRLAGHFTRAKKSGEIHVHVDAQRLCLFHKILTIKQIFLFVVFAPVVLRPAPTVVVLTIFHTPDVFHVVAKTNVFVALATVSNDALGRPNLSTYAAEIFNQIVLGPFLFARPIVGPSTDEEG
jgi:hypothetical protein